MLAVVVSNHGVVLQRMGLRERAREMYEESLALCTAAGYTPGMIAAMINLDLVDGDAACGGPLAAEALTLARDLGDREGTATALRCLAAAARRRGDSALAAAMLDEAVGLFRALRMPVETGEAIQDAASLMEQAPDRAARLLGFVSRSREEGETVWSAEDTIKARLLEESLRRRLGAGAFGKLWEAGRALDPDAAVLETRAGLALIRHGALPPDQSRPPASVAEGLTPREREVLRLVAVGRSDRDIGHELFISPKTANHHVTRILAKLGCSTRAAAVAHGARQGWLE